MKAEIQRHKFSFKQIADNGKYRIKEVVEKNKHEVEHYENKL